MEIMANIIYTCEAKRQKGLLILIGNQKGSHVQNEIVVRHLTIGRTHGDRNATNLDQLIKFQGKRRQKGTSSIVLWMALISVIRSRKQEFCMYGKKVLQSCYQKSKSKHIFLGKELTACVSKVSRFWVEEMLDQEKNLVEQILLPGGCNMRSI
jgi:hypothetical protein